MRTRKGGEKKKCKSRAKRGGTKKEEGKKKKKKLSTELNPGPTDEGHNDLSCANLG